MTDATQPSPRVGYSSHRTAARCPSRLARCRSWLRSLSTELAWILVARHGYRHSYCAVYRSSLAVLLHGLARDVALSHLCQPVHCYAHAVSMAWDSHDSVKRSPLLTR